MIRCIDANQMSIAGFAIVADVIVTAMHATPPGVPHSGAARTRMIGTRIGTAIGAAGRGGLRGLCEEALTSDKCRRPKYHLAHHREKAAPRGWGRQLFIKLFVVFIHG